MPVRGQRRPRRESPAAGRRSARWAHRCVVVVLHRGRISVAKEPGGIGGIEFPFRVLFTSPNTSLSIYDCISEYGRPQQEAIHFAGDATFYRRLRPPTRGGPLRKADGRR